MDVLIFVLGLVCGFALCWFFKSAVLADLSLLHAKIDGLTAALRSK